LALVGDIYDASLDERRARKAKEAWAREQCLFSAGLWRSLAKETEAREMAAHLKLAAD
jgi:hypothetical protein